MFDKLKFSQILNNINNTYDTMTEFSEKSGVNRTYLSQYINKKLDNPPSPKVLIKIATHSNGITTYTELMNVCGYTDSRLLELESLKEMYYQVEDNFLNILSSMKLSEDESEIYHDLCAIVDIDALNGLSENEIHQKLIPYFDNMDYLSNSSKEKIGKKLSFFVQYCLQTNYLRDKISSKSNNVSNLNEKTSSTPKTYYMCPVYGRIAAGQPNWAEECMEGKMPIDPELMNIINPEECYFLKVNGESMNKVIKNGAFALIRKTDWVENGEIAVVLVNGFDATLKKFTKQGDLVILEPMSNDPSFQTQVYNKDTEIKIIGKYIGKMEMN